MNKVILRLKGGIGNQLFSYAAAKRLAMTNDAELVIDHLSGFSRDYKYKRQCQLNHFQTSAALAKREEMMIPFARFRRFLLKKTSQCRPFETRRYLEQEKHDFDERLLKYKIKDNTYIEGYWQSEKYFKDIESTIRQEFEILPPTDFKNLELAAKIKTTNAVCMHVRWFDIPHKEKGSDYSNNVDLKYYDKAIELVREKITEPSFFIFSDYPDETRQLFKSSFDNMTIISHNKGDDHAYADLWLMSLCKHFIIANSTFSWWGAWLSSSESKIVIAPAEKINGISAWGFKGLLPESWIKI